MNEAIHSGLLADDDPSPVGWINHSGDSLFLLIGDHAGNTVPRKLAKLGLTDDELARHIGWDIGIGALGRQLARRLNAAFLFQPYSRLVIDCNRDPISGRIILEESDGTLVPGNVGLTNDNIAARIREIHCPYHQAISREIERRDASARQTILIALHSFAPSMAGIERPWQLGVLHAGHTDRFAHQLLAVLRARAGIIVGDNQPYQLDETDYSVPRHCFSADRPYAELEIRQDLLSNSEAIAKWAKLLAECFGEACSELDLTN